MPTGQCRHCGYTPVAQNAVVCPKCGGVHPNPSSFAKISPVIAIVSAIVGVMVFFIVMYFGGLGPFRK
jgi:hypothetical protein